MFSYKRRTATLKLFVIYVYIFLFYFITETSHQTSSLLYQKTDFLDKWLHCQWGCYKYIYHFFLNINRFIQLILGTKSMKIYDI